MDRWKLWHAVRGKLKGIAIVHRAASYGLELHTELMPEHREEYLRGLCAKLNADAEAREIISRANWCPNSNWSQEQWLARVSEFLSPSQVSGGSKS
jgi:hypothetical protein